MIRHQEKTGRGIQCQGLVPMVVSGHGLDSMTSEVFFNLIDSVRGRQCSAGGLWGIGGDVERFSLAAAGLLREWVFQLVPNFVWLEICQEGRCAEGPLAGFEAGGLDRELAGVS